MNITGSSIENTALNFGDLEAHYANAYGRYEQPSTFDTITSKIAQIAKAAFKSATVTAVAATIVFTAIFGNPLPIALQKASLLAAISAVYAACTEILF